MTLNLCFFERKHRFKFSSSPKIFIQGQLYDRWICNIVNLNTLTMKNETAGIFFGGFIGKKCN